MDGEIKMFDSPIAWVTFWTDTDDEVTIHDVFQRRLYHAPDRLVVVRATDGSTHAVRNWSRFSQAPGSEPLF